ncbi:hypothetical protein AQULUS_02520 [Aquicella lusitana]|nr:hypothetical protein AQULUS_02520 [Aquicella lusitana]
MIQVHRTVVRFAQDDSEAKDDSIVNFKFNHFIIFYLVSSC